MVRFSTKFVCLFISLALAIPCLASDSPKPRLRLKISTDRIRMTYQRFGSGPVGTLSYGKIENGRYYPMSTAAVSYLGTKSCSEMLNYAQMFTLTALNKRDYIDDEMFKFLMRTQDYLNPEQVSFMKIVALITPEEYLANKDFILESQLMFGHSPDMRIEAMIPVTIATMQVTNGYVYGPDGIRRAPMPWTKDKNFADQVAGVIGHPTDHVDYEIGRALQVIPGYIDFAINAALITIAHEMATHKIHADKIRLFIHSFKIANTNLYLKSLETLKVVATDSKNSENVILMAPLKGLVTDQRPWSFAGVLQDIMAVNPRRLDIRAAWEIYISAWSTVRTDMDYHRADGNLFSSPIIWRGSRRLFTNSILATMRRRGIESHEEINKVLNILIERGKLFDNRLVSEEFVDHIATDPLLHREIFNRENVMHISNLHPDESRRDSDYEKRVLLGSVIDFWKRIDTNDPDFAGKVLTQMVFAVTSSDPLVRERLKSLNPAHQEERRWERDWTVGVQNGESILSFGQATVGTYYFDFSALDEIKRKNEDLFQRLEERPAIKQGYFHKRINLERPLGI